MPATFTHWPLRSDSVTSRDVRMRRFAQDELFSERLAAGRLEAAQVDALLTTEASGRLVKNYSGGMRRRLDIAASIVVTPQVLFLDEPTIGLDVTMQKRIRSFIAEYNRRYDATVLLTSHYMADVEALCRDGLLPPKLASVNQSLEEQVARAVQHARQDRLAGDLVDEVHLGRGEIDVLALDGPAGAVERALVRVDVGGVRLYPGIIDRDPRLGRVLAAVEQPLLDGIGVLQEVALERNSHLGYLGNIYKGTVSRVLPGMQAAFVEIGQTVKPGDTLCIIEVRLDKMDASSALLRLTDKFGAAAGKQMLVN